MPPTASAFSLRQHMRWRTGEPGPKSASVTPGRLGWTPLIGLPSSLTKRRAEWKKSTSGWAAVAPWSTATACGSQRSSPNRTDTNSDPARRMPVFRAPASRRPSFSTSSIRGSPQRGPSTWRSSAGAGPSATIRSRQSGLDCARTESTASRKKSPR
jgi:hypothetical protein